MAKRKSITISTPEKLLFADLAKRMNGWRRQFPVTSHRKWKFDLAFPKAKILVEVNGERYHGRYAQQRKDAEKCNYAQAAGYRVFVFPASLVMSKARRALIVEFLVQRVFGVTPDQADATVFTRPLR